MTTRCKGIDPIYVCGIHEQGASPASSNDKCHRETTMSMDTIDKPCLFQLNSFGFLGDINLDTSPWTLPQIECRQKALHRFRHHYPPEAHADMTWPRDGVQIFDGWAPGSLKFFTQPTTDTWNSWNGTSTLSTQSVVTINIPTYPYTIRNRQSESESSSRPRKHLWAVGASAISWSQNSKMPSQDHSYQ